MERGPYSNSAMESTNDGVQALANDVSLRQLIVFYICAMSTSSLTEPVLMYSHVGSSTATSARSTVHLHPTPATHGIDTGS